MAESALENFVSSIRVQSLPRSDRFEVTVTPPTGIIGDARQLSMLCEEAQLPGISATNLPVKVGAWTQYRNTNVEFLTTDIVFTFIVDEAWDGRTIMEDWINASVDFQSKEVAFYNSIVSDIDIKTLNLKDEVTAHWKLIDAMPKLINITPVAWSNTGFIRMSVSFAAKKWERVYI